MLSIGRAPLQLGLGIFRLQEFTLGERDGLARAQAYAIAEYAEYVDQWLVLPELVAVSEEDTDVIDGPFAVRVQEDGLPHDILRVCGGRSEFHLCPMWELGWGVPGAERLLSQEEVAASVYQLNRLAARQGATFWTDGTAIDLAPYEVAVPFVGQTRKVAELLDPYNPPPTWPDLTFPYLDPDEDWGRDQRRRRAMIEAAVDLVPEGPYSRRVVFSVARVVAAGTEPFYEMLERRDFEVAHVFENFGVWAGSVREVVYWAALQHAMAAGVYPTYRANLAQSWFVLGDRRFEEVLGIEFDQELDWPWPTHQWFFQRFVNRWWRRVLDKLAFREGLDEGVVSGRRSRPRYIAQDAANGHACCLPIAVLNACRFYGRDTVEPGTEEWEAAVDRWKCRSGSALGTENIYQQSGLEFRELPPGPGPVLQALDDGFPVVIHVGHDSSRIGLHTALATRRDGPMIEVVNLNGPRGPLVQWHDIQKLDFLSSTPGIDGMHNRVALPPSPVAGSGQKPVTAYHVTRRALLPVIQRVGLQPAVPEGDIAGVYLFKSREDAEHALMNWLGDRIEDWEAQTGEPFDEVMLEVDISGLQCRDTAPYEWTCVEPVPPSRIRFPGSSGTTGYAPTRRALDEPRRRSVAPVDPWARCGPPQIPLDEGDLVELGDLGLVPDNAWIHLQLAAVAADLAWPTLLRFPQNPTYREALEVQAEVWAGFTEAIGMWGGGGRQTKPSSGLG